MDAHPGATAEAKKILELNDNNRMAALEVAQKQLDTVYARAQVLISLAGIVVTVTGFSGRLIAGSSRLAQGFLVAGLFVTLASAIWVFLRVMRVRWVTRLACEDPEHALANALHRRDRKTRAYAVGGLALFIGLALYCISIALMLLDPAAISGPVR